MFWRGTYSLRTLLIGQFLLVAGAAAVVMAVLMAQWRLPVAREQTQVELARVADLSLSQLERTLDNAEELAQALGQVVQVRLFERHGLDGNSEFMQLLTYLTSGSGLYDAIYLIDDNYKVRALAIHTDVAGRVQDAIGNDLSGVAVLQNARRGWDVSWSDQFMSPVQARPVVAVVVPLVGGLLMLEMSVDRLARFARDDALRDNLLLLVVDGKGELVAGPDIELVRSRTNLANLDLVRAAVSGEQTYAAMPYNGRDYMGTARHSERLDWGLVVAYPQEVINAPLHAALTISVVTLVLALGVGVLLATLLARRLDARVNDTVDFAATIARGDYEARARPSRLREIDRIQGSLERMAVTISARERDLAAQERQFRDLVENTADLVIYFDTQAVISYSNPSADRTLLGPGRTLTGDSLLDHVDPDDVANFQYWLRRAIGSRRNSYHGETAMRDARGQRQSVAWSTSVERDADGRVKGFRCIGLNVTRQRAAQEALRHSEARLRAIVEGSPLLAIQWYDREGRVVDWNPASETLLGWTRDEALGKTLDQLIYDREQHLMFVDLLREVERSGRYTGPFEADIRRRGGGTVTLLSTTFRIPDERGQSLFVCMDLDITDRKRAEAELKASERRFQVLFDANPVPLAVMRRQGDDFIYTAVNEAWVRALGYRRDDVIGRTRSERMVLEGGETAWPEALKRLASEGVMAVNEAVLRRADGSTFVSEGMIGLVDSEEGQLVIYSVHDVTELRRIQADLRELNAQLEDRIAKRTESLTLANTELEQALMTVQLAQERLVAQQDRLVQSEKLASLGSLVAGVAHELNTPIGNGLMAISTLQDRAQVFAQKMASGLKRSDLEGFLSQVVAGCEIAVRNMDRASHLVASFKQVAVDQTSDQRRQFELGELVDEILLTLQPTLKRTAHRVECAVPPGLLMDSFPGALGQVLTNLVQNALIHGLDGLSQGVIEVRARHAGEVIELSVADNGRGIPEAVHKQVFDPFFTTKLGQGGSGLGLPIVRNIVAGVLGGEIDFHNRAEGGVAFVVRVPSCAPDGGGPEPTEPAGQAAPTAV